MSNREEKQIEDLFKSTLFNSEINPDEQVWDKVLSGVNEKEKKRKALLVWFVSINMLIIVLGILYNRWQIKMVSEIEIKSNNESLNTDPKFEMGKMSHIHVWNKDTLKSYTDNSQSNNLNEVRKSNAEFNGHISKMTINSEISIKKALKSNYGVMAQKKQINFEIDHLLNSNNDEILSKTNTSLFSNDINSQLKIQKFIFSTQYQLDTFGLIDLPISQNKKNNTDTVNQSKLKDTNDSGFERQIGVSFNNQFFSQFSHFSRDENLIIQRQKSDQIGHGYSSNINLIWNFHRKLSMSFGIGIQSYLFKSEREKLKIEVNPVDSIKAISNNWNVIYYVVYQNDSTYIKQLYRNEFRSITVPLHLYYEFGQSKKNVRGIAHLGLEYNRLNFASSQLKSGEYQTFGMHSEENVIQYNLMRMQLGLGIENKISERFFISFSPFFKASINNIYRNIPYQERPYFIGFQIGMKYYFKNKIHATK
jgi:hypothetical protein